MCLRITSAAGRVEWNEVCVRVLLPPATATPVDSLVESLFPSWYFVGYHKSRPIVSHTHDLMKDYLTPIVMPPFAGRPCCSRPLQFVRNKMYDTVADNRYSVMGKREDCRCSDERYADRFI